MAEWRISLMQLGLVSNCWRTQLDERTPLDALIEEAVRRGYRTIELRQTCLGRYETGGDHVPIAEALAELPGRFPGVRFNIAVNVPFLSAEMTVAHPVFSAGRWAAQAVAGEFPPHLRLVDLRTTAEALKSSSFSALGLNIAGLGRSLAELDGVLSVENSVQPWRPFREIFDVARRALGAEAARLRLCYDPCNLLAAGDEIDPAVVTESFSAEEISLVHFKQRREGQVLPQVCEGDVDWREQLAELQRIRYAGPALFEVASHSQIWECLAESRAYLEQHGLEGD